MGILVKNLKNNPRAFPKACVRLKNQRKSFMYFSHGILENDYDFKVIFIWKYIKIIFFYLKKLFLILVH
jgi:hypothetical protein